MRVFQMATSQRAFFCFFFWGRVGSAYCCWLQLSRRQRLQKSCRCSHTALGHKQLPISKMVIHFWAHTGDSGPVSYWPWPLAVGHRWGLRKPRSAQISEASDKAGDVLTLLRTQMAGKNACPWKIGPPEGGEHAKKPKPAHLALPAAIEKHTASL